jgi:hypothetical protein
VTIGRPGAINLESVSISRCVFAFVMTGIVKGPLHCCPRAFLMMAACLCSRVQLMTWHRSRIVAIAIIAIVAGCIANCGRLVLAVANFPGYFGAIRATQ